jgi:glycosyltransferase involved in cell wall biosynthesis
MNVKTALVHDWLVTWRGGEKVLLELARLFPEAPIYTLFYEPSSLPSELRGRDIRYHRYLNPLKPLRKALLPVLPLAIESFDFSEFDLIVSTSSCVAKGAIARNGAKHICYIHSPMRYIWDQKSEYFGRLLKVPILKQGINFFINRLRKWDIDSAKRVDLFIANSSFVAGRVKNYYDREAVIIHPPIDLKGFPVRREKGDYFLVAGAMVPYKRFDLAIEALQKAKKKLIVAGSGPELSYLKSLADSSQTIVEFKIAPSQADWVELLRGARALIFPGIEDFGMIAIEAMSTGTPVIAAKAGGALDFIIEGKTGLFFEPGNADSLLDCIQLFERSTFDAHYLAEYAKNYSKEQFTIKISEQIEKISGVTFE